MHRLNFDQSIGRFTGKLNDLNCFVELEIKQWSGSKKWKSYSWIYNLLTVTESSTSLKINFFSIKNESYRWPRWLPRSFYLLDYLFIGFIIIIVGFPWTTSDRAAPEWNKLQTKRHSDKKLEGAIRAWTHISFG